MNELALFSGVGSTRIMNYLSVCSGIEAATVAWHHMGWKPVGFSEIEKFPSQVLAHHYPQVTNFGDMTNYKEWKLNDSVGLLVGGTPCQSFSVAGLRKGLEDPRGNLALTYCGLLDKFRPEWFIWENVPGVLSSNGGRDFGSFLGAVAELGYGFAYRVLDAQYFGVAQRRKRVFVVGNSRSWELAAKVLFESSSLCRDTAPSREKRKEVTATSRIGVEISGPLSARDYKDVGTDGLNEISAKMVVAYENHPSDSRVKEMGDVCQTVTSSWGTGGGNIPFVQAFNITFCDSNGTRKDRKNGGLYVNETDTSNTLTRVGVGTNIVQQMAVRRLTPVECERLQGFPDNYTDIKPKSKDTPDGPRYKALGNSMAVPVMAWIGKRIQQVENSNLDKRLEINRYFS